MTIGDDSPKETKPLESMFHQVFQLVDEVVAGITDDEVHFAARLSNRCRRSR